MEKMILETYKMVIAFHGDLMALCAILWGVRLWVILVAYKFFCILGNFCERLYCLFKKKVKLF